MGGLFVARVSEPVILSLTGQETRATLNLWKRSVRQNLTSGGPLTWLILRNRNSKFPMITSIDHLGIAVRSLDEAIPLYEKALGLTCLGREEVASQRVRTAFFDAGGVHLELLEPTSPDSPVAKFILEKGEGVHHVAFRTTDIRAQLKQAASAGVRLIHETPFEGAAGKQVAFLHPKSTRGVLTEFCAIKPAATPAH